MNLTKEDISQLKKHKYASDNLSITYNYIGIPFYNFVLNFLPRWLAPNLITLLGTLVVILNFLAMWWACPQFQCVTRESLHLMVDRKFGIENNYIEMSNFNGVVIGGEFWYFCAVSLFFYMLMDNLDGRQARRTGTSSQLGQLFDHGCDAVVTSLECMITSVTVNIPLSSPIFILQLFVCWTVFFTATWEEYHTGVLKLGRFSGPDDGIILLILTYVLTAIMGGNWWWGRKVEAMQGVEWVLGREWTYGLLLLAFAGVLAVSMSITNIYRVIIHVKKQNKPIWIPIRHLLTLLIQILLSFSTYYFAPYLWKVHCWFFPISLSICLAGLVSRLIVFHMCKKSYELFHINHIPSFFIAIVSVLYYNNLLQNWQLELAYVIFVVSAWGIYFYLVATTVILLCKELDIYFLTIKSKKE